MPRRRYQCLAYKMLNTLALWRANDYKHSARNGNTENCLFHIQIMLVIYKYTEDKTVINLIGIIYGVQYLDKWE